MSVHSQIIRNSKMRIGADAGGDGGDGGTTPPPSDAGSGGTSPANTPDPPPEAKEVDLKSLDSEQLVAVLENPNLYNLPRIKELRDASSELKKLKDQQKADEHKRLEEQKEFEKLAETRKTDLDAANKTIQDMQINQALTNKLVPEGVVDLEAAIALIDRSQIKIDDSGNISGVDEALKSLKEGKGYLFDKSGEGKPNLGTPPGGNPGDGGSQKTKFKRSQLQDPEFYKKNREAILKAQKNGLIEDDLST